MEPKYKLTTEMKEIKNKQVFRIQALRDIPEFHIKKGQPGGWVANEFCLKQSDNAWVGEEAVLLSGASIEGNVLILGTASIENSMIKCTNCKKHFEVRDYVEIHDSDINVEEGLIVDEVSIKNSAISTSTLLLYHRTEIEKSRLRCDKKLVMNKDAKLVNSEIEGASVYVLDGSSVKGCSLSSIVKMEIVEKVA